MYLLPLEKKYIIKILEKHKIDCRAAHHGWADSPEPRHQVHKMGIWEKYGVRMIGVDVNAIEID
jgi:carbamoyl-phosphate synthase large subunit